MGLNKLKKEQFTNIAPSLILNDSEGIITETLIII